MRNTFIAAAAAFSLACLTAAPAAFAVEGDGRGRGVNIHRLGFGVNYWKTIDKIDEKFDRDGFSYLVSYQYAPVPFFKVEGDLELLPDMAGSPHAVIAPELFVTVGTFIYAGAGIGIYYSSGDWGKDPFYMLRVGLDFPIAPRLFLDINANYRFNDWDSVSWNKDGNPGTDTIRLGAALRFTL